jgi:hypothetical protein
VLCVRDETQSLAAVGIAVADRPEALRIVERGLGALKHSGLIADHAAGAIHRMRAATSHIHVLPRTRDEEAARLVQAIQARVVGVAPIHDVEGAGLRDQLIEDVDIVRIPAMVNAVSTRS